VFSGAIRWTETEFSTKTEEMSEKGGEQRDVGGKDVACGWVAERGESREVAEARFFANSEEFVKGKKASGVVVEDERAKSSFGGERN
jgi:hypothetical protein